MLASRINGIDSRLATHQARDREMVACDVEAFAQVETVRPEALYPGIQVQLVASELARVGHEPRNQLTTGTFGPVTLGRHEIVNVDVFSPGQFRSDDEARDSHDFALMSRVGNLVAVASLFLDLGQQVILAERGPQLQQDIDCLLELRIMFRDINFHVGPPISLT